MDDYGFPIGSKVVIKLYGDLEGVVTGHTKNVFGRPLIVVTEKYDDGYEHGGVVYYPHELTMIR